jgi:hypothetical protein
MKPLLIENLSYDQAKMVTESSEDGKNLYMKGIFIEGGLKNQNQRTYPVNEISRAVNTIKEQLKSGYSVLGEVDHPTNLRINLDRVSHMIEDMWMDGSKGCGKLKILPTPMGNLVAAMLQAGVKLGVSSRGSGNVNESSGTVSDFEIVTVDIVAQPSAPNAYPTAVYESLMNMYGGQRILQMAGEMETDPSVRKHVTEAVKRLINELKI